MTHYDRKGIGQMVRYMRTQAQWSQTELAERLNMHRGSISNMELGKHTVSLEDLMRVAQICHFQLTITIDRERR